MIVFEYLYKMMEVFGPLMDEWAHGKFRHIENEDHDVVYVTPVDQTDRSHWFQKAHKLPNPLLINFEGHAGTTNTRNIS